MKGVEIVAHTPIDCAMPVVHMCCLICAGSFWSAALEVIQSQSPPQFLQVVQLVQLVLLVHNMTRARLHRWRTCFGVIMVLSLWFYGSANIEPTVM